MSERTLVAELHQDGPRGTDFTGFTVQLFVEATEQYAVIRQADDRVVVTKAELRDIWWLLRREDERAAEQSCDRRWLT